MKTIRLACGLGFYDDSREPVRAAHRTRRRERCVHSLRRDNLGKTIAAQLPCMEIEIDVAATEAILAGVRRGIDSLRGEAPPPPTPPANS